MRLFWEFFVSLLAAFGLTCLAWLAFGRVLLPLGAKGLELRCVLRAHGDGAGLEHTVSGLLWLRRSGVWRGVVVIEDAGLTSEGLALARELTRHSGVEVRTGGA